MDLNFAYENKINSNNREKKSNKLFQTQHSPLSFTLNLSN